MSSSLEMFLNRLRDPRWIPNISDYCDGRCERCAFNQRCWTYALRQHMESPESEPTPAPVPDVPADRHGIDRDDLTMTASEERAFEHMEQRIRQDPLRKRARHYGTDIWEVIEKMAPTDRDGGWAGAAPGSALSGAVEDVWSLALVIGAKTGRAISAFEHNKENPFEDDSIQTDANGSAKVARLAIAESVAAWEIVRSAGLLDPGLVTYLLGNLKQIESELADRFPLAMAFVRPGFDEEIPGLVRPWSIMPEEEEEEDP
jgi:hypothetical protein